MSQKFPWLVKRLRQLVLFLATAWAIGLVVFALSLPGEQRIEELPRADGIVVLTGGGGRLEAGIELLAQQKGDRLLVSGVHETVAEQDLLNLTKAPDHLFQCCVDLDKASVNTVDNARKSADWARENQFKSLYLVTSDYHIRRSVRLLEVALPDCEILPHPVKATISFRGMAIEYSKFVVTYARTLLSV